MDKKNKNKENFDFCVKMLYKNYDGYDIKSVDEAYEKLKNNHKYRFVYKSAYDYFVKKNKLYTLVQLVKELKKYNIKITEEEVINLLKDLNIVYESESKGKIYGTSLARNTKYLRYSKNQNTFKYTDKTLKTIIDYKK